jgi:hypothetical protein
LPEEIRLYCPHPSCKKDQQWKIDGDNRFWERSLFPPQRIGYQCKNCGRSTVYFFVIWHESDGAGEFLKVGQYPPAEVQPPRDLKLSAVDLEFYRKALTCRNFSFGNGALAYLRRVLENEMNSLLNLVQERNSISDDSKTSSADLIHVRQTGTFEEKARLAAKYLPGDLKPGGSNPFDIIADFASKGMHWEPEEECLDIFDRIRSVFEYLFRNLSFTTEEAKEYVKTLTKLSGSKP